MSNNEFVLNLLALLDKQRSKVRINADIKELEKAIRKIRIVGTLVKGNTKSELNQVIRQLEAQIRQIKIQAKIDNRQLNREINSALRNVSARDIQLNITSNGERLNEQVRRTVSQVREFVSRNPISVNIDLKREKLLNQLATFTNKHTKINESSYWLGEAERLRGVIEAVSNRDELRDATDQFQVFTTGVRATGYAAVSTTDRIRGMLSNIVKVGNYFGLAFVAVNKFRQSLGTLKTNDSILTEISKTSEMAASELQKLGDTSFQIASKYGQLSSSYLTAAQEMSRAGYENVDSMAELSTAAQGAGDMSAEVANQYIIATDKAYKMNGSIEALTETLDGANNITNNNAVSMTELSQGMSVVGSQAASSQMKVNETTAAIGTMIAVTQKSGSEMGNAFKGILMNLQQVTGEVEDGGDAIDEASLTKYEKACNELGVSLSTVKDGVVSLKEPMQILKELSEEYAKLDESDARRANLLSAVGGKYRANALNAILENYDLYEKMLDDYADGIGSMVSDTKHTVMKRSACCDILYQNIRDCKFNCVLSEIGMYNFTHSTS